MEQVKMIKELEPEAETSGMPEYTLHVVKHYELS
jgi:hypothetical protein